MIDSHQASSALADITEIGRRVRQSLFYQRASSMLMRIFAWALMKRISGNH